MTEEKSEDNLNEDENFADLLESYSSGMNENLEVGDKVQGKIIAIGSDSVFVDTGTKIDGAVDRSELLDKNQEMPYKTGDTLELYVVSFNENEMLLSRTMSGVGSVRMIQDAFLKKVPVEGKVMETCKGGLQIEIMKRRAFCPISQIDLKYVEDSSSYVGQTYPFMITRFEENGRNIVVSRRNILSQEQKKLEKAFFDKLVEGDILKGTITRVMPYGAFVELIPGVEGMVHISELSWSRLEKAEDGVNPGESVEVKVLRIEPGEKKDQQKIALSIKQVLGDPWNNISDSFSMGDKVRGKVTHCKNFGAFVEITPGIEGLVHISEMSYKKRILKPEDVVNPGDSVDVLIKEIDIDNRKISLSIRDAEGDPWIGLPEKFKVGQVVNGLIEKKEKFGYFIKLEDGITGLLPKSNFAKAAKPALIERLKEGQSIDVIIENMNVRDRRIALAPGDSNDTKDWQEYSKSTDQSLGALGEKLQAALANKKKK